MRPSPRWRPAIPTCAPDVIVLDDRLLFDVIAGTESRELLVLARDGVARTFSWYYRLARAIATDRIEGALSRHYIGLPADRQAHVRNVLDDLSERVEIVSAKESVPVMSALATLVTVNVLTADAVASALILDAPILVSTRSDLLDRAAAVAGVPTRRLERDG